MSAAGGVGERWGYKVYWQDWVNGWTMGMRDGGC